MKGLPQLILGEKGDRKIVYAKLIGDRYLGNYVRRFIRLVASVVMPLLLFAAFKIVLHGCTYSLSIGVCTL